MMPLQVLPLADKNGGSVCTCVWGCHELQCFLILGHLRVFSGPVSELWRGVCIMAALTQLFATQSPHPTHSFHYASKLHSSGHIEL